MALLRSSSQEENLAGILVTPFFCLLGLVLTFPKQLLSKLPERFDPEAHGLVRPLLLRFLLKNDKAYAELVVSVLAPSLEAVPMTEMFARAVAPVLVDRLFQEASDDHAEQVLSCLLHASRLVPLPEPMRVSRRCIELVTTKTASSLVHAGLSLLRAVGSVEESSLFEPLVCVFCTQHDELKFEALSVLLETVSVQSEATVRECAPALRLGLFDLVRSKKSRPLWAVMRMVVQVTRKLGGDLSWAVGGKKSDGFFALLVGLVGVEVSLAFDRAQVGPESQMIMACLEVLEAVMQGLRGDEERDECVMLLLPLREKLTDICRVALEFLIEGVGKRAETEPDDLRPLVATRMVSSWAFLDPDAFRPKEMVALMPVVVERMPWFLSVLAEYWAAQDDLRDAFVVAGGMARLLKLLEQRLPAVARDPDGAQLEQWGDEYVVNAFDSVVSGLAVVVTCGLARRNLGLDDARCDGLMRVMLEAARLLMGRRDSPDSASLLGFVVAAVAQLLRIGAPLEDASLHDRAALVLALYLPVAVVSEGLLTLLAVADCIENGERSIAAAMSEVGTTDLLRDTLRGPAVSPEQSAAIKKVLNALKN